MKAREEGIIGQVRHALATEPRVDAPKIRITMVDSQLLLSGIVDDKEQIEVAGAVARRAAPGVPIENALTTHLAAGAWQDSDLIPRVREALAAVHDAIGDRPADVGCEVRAGVAYLMGRCHTLEDRDAFISAAGGVPGVKSVDVDRLLVAPYTDAARTASFARKYLQMEAPDLAGAVRIFVHERSARLVGHLRHQADRDRAVAIVKHVPGIQKVHDELALYQAGPRSRGADAQLEQAVRRALGDAGLAVPDMAVFAVDRTITLMGSVDSPVAQREASRVAREVTGVAHVDNQLEIASAQGNAPHPEGDRRVDIHSLPKRETGKRK